MGMSGDFEQAVIDSILRLSITLPVFESEVLSLENEIIAKTNDAYLKSLFIDQQFIYKFLLLNNCWAE